MEGLIGTIFIIFVVVRVLLGKEDTSGPAGPPWMQ